MPLAHGLGLGAEPPLIGLGRGASATFEEGMVLSVQSWVAEQGTGGCLERATTPNRQQRSLDAHSTPESEMTDHRTAFNHVGLCVSDRARSRRFYEGLLGFQFWWELAPPDSGTDRLLQLDPPLGLHATYLVRDGLVLELLDYSRREVHTGPQRVMDEVGLTHVSLSVSALASVLQMMPDYGGSVVSDSVTAVSAMIRDPDGQLLELLDDGWLAALPPRP